MNLPDQRVGSRTAVLVSVAGALAGLVFAVLLYQRFGAQEVQYGLRGYRVVSDQSVLVTFEVIKEPTATAVCRVRARDRAGAEVGGELVDVGPQSTRRTVVEHPLATTGRANTGEVTGCEPR